MRQPSCLARYCLGQAGRCQSHRADSLDAVSYVRDRHADDRGRPGSYQYNVRIKVPAERTFGAAAHATQAAGGACETVQVEQEHPHQAIIDTAESKGCELIVMASHGRHGNSAIVLGSETVKVLHPLQDPGASPSVNHSSCIQHAQM